MLIRNCEIEKFLKKGDFNVRLTLFDRNPMFYVSDAYYKAWIETIRDSLGGSIINSKAYHTYVIRKLDKNGELVLRSYYIPGSKLISVIKSNFFDTVKSIRIDMIDNSTPDKSRAWIVLVPEFEKY